MATKSSSKKSAPKKAAAKPKVAVKKTATKKAKPAPAKKAKPAVKAAAKKKTAVKTPIKKSVIAKAKPKATKNIKVVNNKQKNAALSVKPITQTAKKTTTVKTKTVKAVKNTSAKAAMPVKSKKTETKVASKPVKVSSKTAAAPKADPPLKPVTKPILKKSAADAAASLRNLAIRAKYKKVEIEYPVHSAKHILFSYLSTSSGLSEWFADTVTEKGDIMVFEWDGTQQAAKVLSAREDHHIRFRWLDMPEAIYFEFRVETDEITGDLALIITDFCEDENSIESTKNLWNSQIDKLFHVLGIH